MLRYIKWDLDIAKKYNLKNSELPIFVLIYSHCMDYGELSCNCKDIAEIVGCNVRTVNMTIDKLIEKSLIIKMTSASTGLFIFRINQNGLSKSKENKDYKTYEYKYGERKFRVIEKNKNPLNISIN